MASENLGWVFIYAEWVSIYHNNIEWIASGSSVMVALSVQYVPTTLA
jgi:hypothetical protein